MPGTFVVSLTTTTGAAAPVNVTVGFGASTGGAVVRQWQANAEGADESGIMMVTLQPLAAGSTLVAFVSEENITGTPPGSGPPPPITLSDGAGNVYALLDVANDTLPGVFQGNMSFASTNVAATSQPLTVTATYPNENQWLALVVVEVANVQASPLVAVGNSPSNLSGATNSDATPSMSLSSPALILALAASQGLTTAPTAGTGFTALGTAWNWEGLEETCVCPSALLEYATFANPGNVAATFTPAAPNDNLINLAVALRN
jgi:hypothetical protein